MDRVIGAVPAPLLAYLPPISLALMDPVAQCDCRGSRRRNNRSARPSAHRILVSKCPTVGHCTLFVFVDVGTVFLI